MTTPTATTHTAFIFRSKVHLTMADYKRRASCSQRIPYMGTEYELKTWHPSDQCKRCFKGYPAA